MKKGQKYEYLNIVQGSYDYRTWKDVYVGENLKDAKARLKEYRANEGAYSHRLIERRVPIQ